MKIMGLGINYSTGELLVRPVDEQSFGAGILHSLVPNAAALRKIAGATRQGVTFREAKRQQVDLGEPRSAGWTFLINGNDPQKNDLINAIHKLAEHRGMQNPDQPLVFNGEPPDQWGEWLIKNYSTLNLQQKPYYILILGSPQQVPFLFQALLDTAAAVGRLDFDSPRDLETYVEKVIRLETAPDPVVKREAFFFAPATSPPDPTYFSRHYLAEPLADDVKERLGFGIKALVGLEATKARLKKALRGAQPALVFTASHGMAAIDEPLQVQQRVNGAICCQRTGKQGKTANYVFTADDVPLDEPFLEGAAFFQFACFGYGTPAESDFAHWDWEEQMGIAKVNAAQDFVATLPKCLLAHPRGPIAYVGHLDIALLHGFDDPDNPFPDIGERWHPRVEPFRNALDQLLGLWPAGYAMSDMNARYNATNAQITSTLDRVQRGLLQVSPEFQVSLATTFLARSDAQNYMVFGDPAARLRIPD